MLALLQRTLGFLVGLVLLAAALIYASLILALAAALAILIGGWLWWKTRNLRRAARRVNGAVVEGDYRVEEERRRLDERR